MSALAQAHVRFPYSIRPLSELEALRTIGQITWQGKNERDSLLAIAAAVLRIPGLSGVRFNPKPRALGLEPYEEFITASAAFGAFESSPVEANGENWGEIQLHFNINSPPRLENPKRFAQFIGEQIGILFQRLSLLQERRLLDSRLAKLHMIVRRRKLIYGAAGVLAKQRSISKREAISQMVEYAKNGRRNLLAVSESLIIGYDLSQPTRPFFRRLSAKDPVSSRRSCG